MKHRERFYHVQRQHQTRQLAALVPCPSCGRAVGMACVTASGVDASNPHRVRINMAWLARKSGVMR